MSEDRVVFVGLGIQFTTFKRIAALASGQDEPDLILCRTLDGLPYALTGDENARPEDEDRSHWILPDKVFYSGGLRQYDPQGAGMNVYAHDIDERIMEFGLSEDNVIYAGATSSGSLFDYVLPSGRSGYNSALNRLILR
tara:strand:+ start:2812 stop:3228 length:417 start_codon:yes stop_codon:yes gene_type:complete